MNPSRVLTFGEGALTRASSAYHPETGVRVGNNVPRISPSRILKNSWTPKTFFHFTGAEAQLAYADLLTRQSTFESGYPGFTRLVLGTSDGARDIVAYRLGPVSRKHFVVVQGVFGDVVAGANGTFKAMEILHDEAEFGPFRDEWTILFIPALNPDGWSAGTHNLTQIGPNGQTVNLDRNFDWYWDDYVEIATESKGSAAESSNEASALLTYFRTANGGGPVTFGFLMDLEGDAGTGTRYQARDRIFRAVVSGPGTPTPIPGGYLEIDLDFKIARTIQAVTNVRARVESGPDFFCRPLRTRFTPRLHQYFSSQGVPSLGAYEMVGGLETVQTAANFRMDYILSAAASVTTNFWTAEDALILEKAATNLLPNAAWNGWDGSDVNPTGYAAERAALSRLQSAPEVTTSPERFIEVGEAVQQTTATDLALPSPAEYVRAGEISETVWVACDPTNAVLLRFGIEDNRGFESVEAINHGALVGTALTGGLADIAYILGGATAAPDTGVTTTVTRIATLSSTPAEASDGNLSSARSFHGACSNILSSPAGGDERIYVFGGFTGAGDRLTTIEVYNPNTSTSSAATATFNANGWAEFPAVYHPVLNQVFLFGGTTDDSSGTPQTTIWRWDVTGDTLVDMSTIDGSLALAEGLRHMAAAYDPNTGNILAFGGENTAGNFSDSIYSLDPVNLTLTVLSLTHGLSDDEAQPEVAAWTIALARHAAVASFDASGVSSGKIYLLGGRIINTVGALQEDGYYVDTTKGIIDSPRISEAGYVVAVNPVVDSSIDEDGSDDFSGTLAAWTEANGGVWGISGGQAFADGGTDYLIFDTVPTYRDQTVSIDLLTNAAADTLPEVAVIVRGTFSIPNFTDGYRVVFDDADDEWRIEKVVSSSTTVLATLDVTGDSDRQLVSGGELRTLTVSVRGADPVVFNVTFNGLTIFTDVADLAEDRITTIGQVALDGGGPV